MSFIYYAEFRSENGEHWVRTGRFETYLAAERSLYGHILSGRTTRIWTPGGLIHPYR